MAHDVTIPAVGESITEGVLARWLVADGAAVEEGQPIYELETDKISTEVEAEQAGVLTQQVAEGETVEVGAVVGSIDPDAAPASGAGTDGKDGGSKQGGDRENVREHSAAENQAAKAEAGAEEADDDADTHYTPTEDTHVEPEPPPGTDQPLSPAVRRLVEEHGLNPSAIPATGKDGRLTKSDVLRFLDEDAATPAGQPPAPGPGANVGGGPSAPPTPAPKDEAGVTRSRMSPLRQRIAQRLVNAQRTAAILTTFNEVDMSACMALRSRFKQRFEEVHGTRLGFMSFFTRAAAEALATYPRINAQIDGDEIVQYEHAHIGIAVGTDKGLVVPVLRKAEQMSFAEIEGAIRDYAKRARDGKLKLDDMAGGTFTISNGGAYGSMMSTPILNPPQSGILGMHAITERPVAVNGEVVIRPMMYIALSYDHRIVDGAEAVGFLVRVKKLIEEPERLIFDL